MLQSTCIKVIAEANNRVFEKEVNSFLRNWIHNYEENTWLKFDQTLEEYLANDALRDFFLSTQNPVQQLLNKSFIAGHLSRCVSSVYFDPTTGDPLLASTEQRIYNLARRMESEGLHVPFRSVQPNKQTEAGDTSDISTYPIESEEIRYNSGNHFTSRSANDNVFDEHSTKCVAKANGSLHVVFKRGFLEDRLRDIKEFTADLHNKGETQPQFFVIYSRHSPQEGHFGVSLVIMDPARPEFPVRVMVCDTLLKELPQHPRWWPHFVAEYSNVFGSAVAEILEDLSHPLQKVNIKGDHPYRHDWDCPYYAASMANALAVLVNNNKELLLNGSLGDIHNSMKSIMPDYYHSNSELKDRAEIQQVNRLKRWSSGREVIKHLVMETIRQSSYEL